MSEEKKELTPTEIEFQAYTDLLIGEAVTLISQGSSPHAEIRNVIVKVLHWLHSKEEFHD